MRRMTKRRRIKISKRRRNARGEDEAEGEGY